MGSNNYDYDLRQDEQDSVLSEFRTAREKADLAKLMLTRKIKLFAWLTSIALPTLFLWSVMGQIGYAGLGGIVMLIVLVPILIISIFPLRLITGQFYRVILNKQANQVLRVIVLCIGFVATVGLLYLLWQNAFAPYGSVKALVNDIPEMEAYFVSNKNEFDKKLSDGARENEFYYDSTIFYVKYPSKSNGHLLAGFCYDEKSTIKTGYQ